MVKLQLLQISNSILNGRKFETAQLAQLVRDNFTSTTTAVGAQQTAYADDFLREILAQTVLGQLPIQMIAGGNKKFTIPRLDSVTDQATWGWLPEGSPTVNTAANFSQIVLEPKRWTGEISVSRTMVLEGGGNVERYITTYMTEQMRNSLERDILETVRSGAVQLDVATPGAVSALDIQAALRKLAEKNILKSETVAIVSPSMMEQLRITPVIPGSTSGESLSRGYWVDGRQFLMTDCPIIESSLVKDGTILLGSFKYVTVCTWQDSYLDQDLTTYKNRDLIAYRNTSYLDVALTHPEAFVSLNLNAPAP